MLLAQSSTLYLLREEREGQGKLFFSTEKELVFDTFSMKDGEKIATGTHKVPCRVLAEWSLKASEVEDLTGIIRMFGGIYEKQPVRLALPVEK